MPFMTPQYLGHKEGTTFLLSLDITWEDDYMKKGEEIAKRYREESSQQRFMQGWKRAFEENANSTETEEE